MPKFKDKIKIMLYAPCTNKQDVEEVAGTIIELFKEAVGRKESNNACYSDLFIDGKNRLRQEILDRLEE